MKQFNPLGPTIDNAALVAEAKELLHALIDHVDRIRPKYAKGAEFLEDMAARFAVGSPKDHWVTQKQLDYLQGLYDRYVEGKR